MCLLNLMLTILDFVVQMICQMDGFDQTVNVKVIMATNRADTLDPALIRPGRLDRKIEFPLPDRRQKRLVFQVSSIITVILHIVCYMVVWDIHFSSTLKTVEGTYLISSTEAGLHMVKWLCNCWRISLSLSLMHGLPVRI